MSSAKTVVEGYAAWLALPWRDSLSAAERVVMLVYPPAQERRIRARLPELDLRTTESGRTWREVDISNDLGRWIAGHEYAAEFFADPSEMTDGILEDFERELVERLRATLADAGTEEVVCLIGVGSLFPFVRTSFLISALESAVIGRLLVLFPGHHDSERHTFRLLDARDGFNYRARVISVDKDS